MLSSREIVLVTMMSLQVLSATGVLYGRAAAPGQFRYQVLLTSRQAGRVELCGGAIIGERHILTAWHCVENKKPWEISVIVGAVKIGNDTNAEAYRVSQIKLHKERVAKRSGQMRCYDIAILTIAEPIVYNDYINEVVLANEDLTDDTECVFAGWGFMADDAEGTMGDLKYGYGRIFPNLRNPGMLNDYEFYIQALEHEGTQPRIVKGDSGSPIVCDGVLTGIIINATTEPSMTIAINVYKLLTFINKNMDDAACCCTQ